MEINISRPVAQILNGGSSSAAAVKAPQPQAAAGFPQAEALESKLVAQPDTRAAVVERAQELLASSTYPPAETIQKIARLLAAHLQN